MKKYIIGLSIAAFTISLSGCADFLEEPVRGQQDLNEYFKNEDECKQQITGCYQSIFYDDWWQIQKFYLASDMCTDDMWMGNTTQDPGEYRDLAHYTGNTYAAGNCCQNFWQYRYKGILRSNVAIEQIPNVTFENENLKKRYIAEAKFLRAFHYFELVRNFGGVPLVLGLKLPSEVVGIQRATVEQTYEQIEKDLLEAISDLPKKSEYDASDLGRVTKGAAQGYLAKAYLYQGKFEEAEPLLQEIICRGDFAANTPEYELLKDFGHVWSIDHNNSAESLFEVQTNSDIAYNLGERISIVCGSRNDSGWAWGIPTSNLEKVFLEEAPSGETPDGKINEDYRLRWTIIKDGATKVFGDPDAKNPYQVSWDDHKSGRVTRKLYIPVAKRPSPYDAPHIPLNYRLLRYADILLMYAEVENELGRDDEAKWALNKVRKRVYLSEVTATGTSLRDAIRKERRMELALENNRLYDLRRWKDENGKPEISKIMGANGAFVKYNLEQSTDQCELGNQKENSNKGINFKEGRDELFPLPPSEIIMSGGSIEQNPGY